MILYIIWGLIVLGAIALLKDRDPIILGGILIVMSVLIISIGPNEVGLLGVILIPIAVVIMGVGITSRQRREFRNMRAI